MQIKNKRAMEGGMWWIIIGAIVAIIVAGVMIYIVKGGLSTGQKNIDALGRCESQGGYCKPGVYANSKWESKCDVNEASYYKFGGCLYGQYCCIPKT